MLIKYTYPVVTSLFLTEHWPITVGGIKIEWKVDNGRPASITAMVSATDEDKLPTIEQGSVSGAPLKINFGSYSRQNDVEQVLRTTRGLLGLFASIEIDFDAVEIEWQAENEEERQQIKIPKLSRETQKADLNQSRHLRYDLVARTVALADSAAYYEIPLGFLRRGSLELHAGRYIESFYNFFFFLETLFAPGYSNPKMVEHKLCAAAPVRAAISHIRAAKNGSRTNPKRSALLALTDELLIQQMVKIRGSLHHHALRRPSIWHPDRPDEFREEAHLLMEIVHQIAMQEAMPLLFTPECDKAVFSSAKAAGVITRIRIEPIGLVGGERTKLTPMIFEMPCQDVDRETVDHVHRQFKAESPLRFPGIKIVEYEIMSEDRSNIYAAWRYLG